MNQLTRQGIIERSPVKIGSGAIGLKLRVDKDYVPSGSTPYSVIDVVVSGDNEIPIAESLEEGDAVIVVGEVKAVVSAEGNKSTRIIARQLIPMPKPTDQPLSSPSVTSSTEPQNLDDIPF